jgi:glyoxylase-like metal-dependent hydrolase (beta-lactamase superfamily II)
VALACTHYFRDHSAGAAAAARAGIPVHVPETEASLYADPGLHFQSRESYIVYENYWHHFAPVEPIAVAGVLRDYDRVRLAGLEVEVLPLPGATVGQAGLVLRRDGRTVVLCGETIHSPGRLPRLAPLQWGYNDLDGAYAVLASVRDLRKLQPDVLLPSLGEPILDGVDDALAALEENLRATLFGRLDPELGVEADPEDGLKRLAGPTGALARLSDHVWCSTEGEAIATFLLSEAGETLALDYGYDTTHCVPSWQMEARPLGRRALLHSLDGLERVCGRRRIDVVVPTHYHDDHVAGIPVLQRVFGTQCWAAESFADLLERPQDFTFPCTWPVPTRVDRRLPLGSTVRFHEYELTIGPAISGHTRFAALIGFEADGLRFAHTGDQYHGSLGWVAGRTPDWTRDVITANEVYRNGMRLDGYHRSARWLGEFRPDVVITGHQAAFRTDDAFFATVEEHARSLEATHRRLMALGDADPHFEADSWGGFVRPYRTHLPEPGPARVVVTVRNPLPERATLDVRLTVPEGWTGESASLEAGPREDVSAELGLVAAAPCRRQPIAVELEVAGQPYGQVAEALVTVGGALF